jgi:hypothetical protein
MRRSQELIPLSRFHRTVLFTAQNCLTDGARFSGYPLQQSARRTYLMEQWPSIKTHFKILQKTLSETMDVEAGELADLIKSMNEEQEAVRESVIKDKRLLTDESLNQIGELLEVHVRNTERKLFQCIQKEVNNSVLNEMGSVVRSNALYRGLLNIKST